MVFPSFHSSIGSCTADNFMGGGRGMFVGIQFVDLESMMRDRHWTSRKRLPYFVISLSLVRIGVEPAHDLDKLGG
jgi:hypothetical protein